MKKMRKIIPALAMLLVSAIMMSTASFAWFTMNDEVTATGMQIQAKSTGSLVIGNKPLLDTDKTNTTVTLDTTQKTLTPVTWMTETEATGLSLSGAGWYKASGLTVNPVSGKAGAFEALSAMTSGTHYFDQEIYIGSAGDTMLNQSITVNLSSLVHPADEIAHNAYAAAIYVFEKGNATWNNDTYPDDTAEPIKVVHVANWDALNSVTLYKDEAANKGFDIPSVIGLTSTDNAVGLKIVVRVFVDGNLVNDDKTVQLYKNGYVEATGAELTFDKAAGVVYYELDGSEYKVVNTTEFTDGKDMTGYYVFSDKVADGAPVAQYCINSNNVPTAASSLEFSFKATTLPTTP